jgi:sterol 14-demethylase
MILFLVFSGSESTPLQTCWALILLLQHPAYCQRVLQEQAAVLPDGVCRLTAKDLDRLVLLEWALKESERLRPMTTMLWRKTVSTYTLGPYEIPKGWITMICPAVSHCLPDVFSNPHAYDPTRFGPPREEDLRVPFSLVGFGGGSHKCPGHRLAYAFMKTVVTLVLNNYSCELSTADPQPDYSTFIGRPPVPCLVRYRRRAATESAHAGRLTLSQS